MPAERNAPSHATVEYHLERVRHSVARLEAISFVDGAKGRGLRPPDGPLVRTARRLERLLAISR
jgi:hypothetical protein